MKPMKKTLLCLCSVIFSVSLSGQVSHQRYTDLIKTADSLYNAKDFRNSAFSFSRAFEANGWSATSKEHYNAACSWALANFPDLINDKSNRRNSSKS